MSAVSSGHRAGECVADKYLLVRVLEMGGMGAVWVAHHLALDVHVALKFILPQVACPTATARLIREAQAAARVRHPAIVQVLDVGQTAAGETYLAMELLDGEVLADVLNRERRLDPMTAVRVLLPIADVLDALHRSGIIHRDVKPDNIFLTRDDAGRWQPKLIDFGLARSTDQGVNRLTEAGAMLGTPAYMSRERLLGEDVDASEDVYALAVVLYEAMTGALPFDGETPLEVFSALTADRPRSTVDHGAGDAPLWAVVERGLASRSERWASARDLGRALAAWAWQNGGFADIAGMSLRPTWIDADEAERLDGSVSDMAATVRVVAPASLQTTTPPAPPCEDPSTSVDLDDWLATQSSPDALPARVDGRWYTVLAAAMAVFAIATWSALLVHELLPEPLPAADERGPDAVTAGNAPEPGSKAAAEVANAPPGAGSAPSSSANVPADTPASPAPIANDVGRRRPFR
jgi:serine/threonine-protein kinase